MNRVRCPICRRMYEFSGLPPKCCPECYFAEESQYQMVRSLVKDRPGITIIDAAEITGVPQAKIMRYLREDRLEAISMSTSFLKCTTCGKIINTGTHCADCIRRNGDGPNEPPPDKAKNSNRKNYNIENA